MFARNAAMICLLLCVSPVGLNAQTVEIGFRLQMDALSVWEYNRRSQLYENAWNYDPTVIHTSIAVRINQHVIPGLRVGYALGGPYDGWEMGFIFKSEVVKNLLYVLACDWLHWNRGGYGGMTSSTYETFFNAPGIGVGLIIGGHFSLEAQFLKPFGGDLGYTLAESPPPVVKKPTKLLGVIRMGFGFSWEL